MREIEWSDMYGSYVKFVFAYCVISGVDRGCHFGTFCPIARFREAHDNHENHHASNWDEHRIFDVCSSNHENSMDLGGRSFYGGSDLLFLSADPNFSL